MINLPLWVLPEKFPSIYDSESATAIEMVGKVYAKMRELVDSYNEFANEVNVEINQFVAQGEYDKETFKVAMSQRFQDFIDAVELKLKTDDTKQETFVNTANTLLETLKTANNSFRDTLNGDFLTHQSMVDQRLQEYEQDTEVTWDEIANKPFGQSTVDMGLESIYRGAPTWDSSSNPRAIITPSKPLDWNTQYRIIVDEDVTVPVSIGSPDVLTGITFTHSGYIRVTAYGTMGEQIMVEMLNGAKPYDLAIEIISKTVVDKQLDPIFIPPNINVDWDYILNKPFGHERQRVITWDGDTLPYTNGVKPKFGADIDTGFYHVSDYT